MEVTKPPHSRLITALMIAILVIGAVLVILDWQNIHQVLLEADWRFIPLVLIFTILSYSFYSLAYGLVARLLGIKMRLAELAEACFISTVVNHVLTSGGVVGYSLRYLLMKMYNVSLNEVLSSSFLHYYLTSLDMLTILPLSFLYLMLHSVVPRGVAIALGMMTLIFGLILVLITVLVIFPSRRRPIINLFAAITKKLLKRDLSVWLDQFDETLTHGTQVIRRKPLALLWIMLLTVLDFASSIAALGFVFEALGPGVKAGALVSGYVIGIMAGLISMIPGGFGIQEGSMAGTYALLGVHLEQAVLAVILFRLLYYLVPYFLILPFYRRLLQQAGKQAKIAF
jgi:uncharacterized protein (TIRG00374 family)